jgi:hypothetical protein
VSAISAKGTTGTAENKASTRGDDYVAVAFDNNGRTVTLNFIPANGSDGRVTTDVESPQGLNNANAAPRLDVIFAAVKIARPDEIYRFSTGKTGDSIRPAARSRRSVDGVLSVAMRLIFSRPIFFRPPARLHAHRTDARQNPVFIE